MARKVTKAKATKAKATKADAVKTAERRAKATKAIATKAQAKAAVKAAKAAVARKRQQSTYKPKPGTGLEFSDSQRIVLKVKSNPKRAGSASHARFEQYFKAKPRTVADALKAGITRADIRWDAGQGFIELK